LLVDTHALLWWLTDNPRLSYAAEAAISDIRTMRSLSVPASDTK
jgi:PIN domain nuclease of toxin-antitoxin system